MKKISIFTYIIISMFIVFIAGSFFGFAITNNNLDETASLLRQSELNTESYVIEQELIANFDESNCNLGQLRIQQHSEELYRIGKRLEGENRRHGATLPRALGGKNAERVDASPHMGLAV